MKQIKVHGRSNPLIKFLMNRSGSKYFGLIEMWPSPIPKAYLPEDTCSLFKALAARMLLLTGNFVVVAVIAFLAGFSIYSVIITAVVWLHFGFNPLTMGQDLAVSTGVAWYVIILSAVVVFSGNYLYNKFMKLLKSYVVEEPKSKPKVASEGARLACVLLKSIKEKTCFKIDYNWEKK